MTEQEQPPEEDSQGVRPLSSDASLLRRLRLAAAKSLERFLEQGRGGKTFFLKTPAAVTDRLEEMASSCRRRLELYGILANCAWQEEATVRSLSEDEKPRLRAEAGELLFLLAALAQLAVGRPAESADLGPDMTNVMTVVVHSPENASTHYQVKILDSQGNSMEATVLLDAAGRLEVRVPNVHSAQNYYVQVQDADHTLAQPTDFDVEVDFAQDSTHLQTFVNQSLRSDQPEYTTTLQVLQSQEFHFALSATDWSAPVETGVRMTIYDAAGQAVFTTTVADGASRSADVFLNAGLYTVRFTRANDQGSSLQPILFELSGKTESDPLGPQLRDTTLGPVDSVTSPVAPPTTFFWLPYVPTDLAVRGMPNLTPSSIEPITFGTPSSGASTQSFLMQSRTIDLPRSISLMDVVGLSITQPISVSPAAAPSGHSVWSLNSISHQGSRYTLLLQVRPPGTRRACPNCLVPFNREKPWPFRAGASPSPPAAGADRPARATR